MSDYYYSPSTFVSYAVRKANEYGGFAGEDDKRHIIIAMMHIDMLF